MSAKTFENGAIIEAGDLGRHLTKRTTWKVTAFLSFAVSAVSFVVGFLLSVLSALQIVTVSRLTANFTVASLLLAFASAFFGAHALDKLESELTERDR